MTQGTVRGARGRVAGDGPGPRRSGGRLSLRNQESVVLAVAVLLALALAATVPSFRTLDNVKTLVDNVAVLGILGVALSLVVIGRGFDLSLVSTMAVSVGLTLNALPRHGTTSIRSLPRSPPGSLSTGWAAICSCAAPASRSASRTTPLHCSSWARTRSWASRCR
jgi:ribose/xylose/arabinose/galactoside ABC-type transport system permease subunit